MGFQHLSWAREQDDLDSIKKFVLIILASYTDTDGTCWPNQDMIASDTGLSRRTVQRHLAGLDEAGKIEVAHRPGEGLGRKSNRYRLLIDTGAKRHSDALGQSDTAVSSGNVTRQAEGKASQLWRSNSQKASKTASRFSRAGARGGGEDRESFSLREAEDRETGVDRTGSTCEDDREQAAAMMSAWFERQGHSAPFRKVRGKWQKEIQGLIEDGAEKWMIEKALDQCGDRNAGPGMLSHIADDIRRNPMQYIDLPVSEEWRRYG